MSDLGPLLTPREAAEYRRVTPEYLAQERYYGRGPRFIKQGRKVLYRLSDVNDWLERQTRTRTDQGPSAA